MSTQQRWTLVLFILPGLLMYAVFKLLPALGALLLSLTQWNGVSARLNWVGLANYLELFSDKLFLNALGNNLRFTLVILTGQTAVSLLLALLLVRKSRWSLALRTVFFLPIIISSVSIAFIWTFMYDPNVGAINTLLKAIGLANWTRTWLGDPRLALYCLAFVQIWTHAGQLAVIFIAGLQSIPAVLYEAAAIEGAGRWQTFRHVTWPLLAPATTIVLTLTTIQSFKAFDLILLMTQGGPAKSTDILSTYLYDQAFNFFRFGYAAAAAVVFLAIIAIITAAQFRLLRARQVSYQ